MKLQKIRALIIAMGFLWILCASLIGSLIGTKINSILAHDPNSPWLFSLEKTLLISSHSHLNLMGTVTILVGVTIHFLWNQIPQKWLKFLVLCHLTSTPLFVFGLLGKACFQESFFVFYTGMTTLGAMLFITSMIGFASCFFTVFFTK